MARLKNVHVRVVITAVDPQGALIEKHVAPSYRKEAEDKLREQGCTVLESPTENPWWLKYQTPPKPPPSAGEGIVWAIIGVLCLIILCGVTFAACGAALTP